MRARSRPRNLQLKFTNKCSFILLKVTFPSVAYAIQKFFHTFGHHFTLMHVVLRSARKLAKKFSYIYAFSQIKIINREFLIFLLALIYFFSCTKVKQDQSVSANSFRKQKVVRTVVE